MRGRGLVLGALGASLMLAVPAAAQGQDAAKNVQHLKTIPEAKMATAINFLEYRQGGHGWDDDDRKGGGGRTLDVMAVTGRFGVKTYSLENPAKPKLLDEISAERLKLEGDPDVDFGPPDTSNPTSTFWQNEDMDVDQDRKLLILSRDPRAYGGTTNNSPGDPMPNGALNVAGVYIVDARDPEALRLLAFQELPTGHTTTCINDCRWLWTGGPAATTKQQAAPLNWTGGRPIIVTDLSDPRRPRAYPMQPVDLFRRDGVTAYSHDVQVDDDDIAWVSGDGGTRGYYTDGRQWDPIQRRYRKATPLEPVPYAGGGIPRSVTNDDTGGFEHNAERPVGRDAPRGDDRYKKGELLLMTEEDFGACGGGLQQAGSVHDRVAEGLLQRRGLEVDPGQPVPPAGGRQVVAVRAGGLAAGCRPVPAAGELLLGALLRRRRQHRVLRLVRRGHALPGHLRPGQPAPDRLLAPGQRHRLGLLQLQGLHLHRRPHPRRGRPQADQRCEGGRRVQA